MAPAPHAVLLLGVPRGGTTWVGNMLGATAGARYVHEPDGTHEPFAFVAKLRLLHHPMIDATEADTPDLDAYARLWRGAFSGGLPAGGFADTVARRVYRGLSGEQKMAARQRGEQSWRTRVVVAAARPLRPAPPDIRHVVVKSVNGAFAAEWIARHGADHVGVISRHPLNVVASWRDFGWNPPQGVMYAAIRDRALRDWEIELPPADAGPLARAAAMATALAYELERVRLRNPSWIAISHEDVCTEPETRFASVAAALGLEWNEAAAQAVSESNRPGAGYVTNRVASAEAQRWRERLTSDEVGEVVDVASRFPAELGWLEHLG